MSDLFGFLLVQKSCEIRNPLEPEPGARCAMNREICKQFVQCERGKTDSAADRNRLRRRMDRDVRDHSAIVSGPCVPIDSQRGPVFDPDRLLPVTVPRVEGLTT